MRSGAVLAMLVVVAGCGLPPAVSGGPTASNTVKVGDGAVSFDDINHDPATNLILAPARADGLTLIHPDTLEATAIEGHADSVSSGAGFLFVLDRGGALRVLLEGEEVARFDGIGGDYVRYVAPTNEVWVTQPRDGRIDVLTLADDGSLSRDGVIAAVGGPEGLTIDPSRGLAVTHAFTGDAMIVDVQGRRVVANIGTGCFGAHGVPAIDEDRGLAFFGCSSAEIVAISLDEKSVTGRFRLGDGESLMAYDPVSRRAFLRGDPGDAIAVIDVTDDGKLSALSSRTATERGHCLLAAAGSLWACDEPGGAILRFDLE